MSKQRKVFTVYELNRYIKMKLASDQVLQHVWIQGEISNFTHHSSGHMYFTLKDRQSRIRCIMFKSHNERLKFIPREGSNVLAAGNVSVYERDGQYQLYVTQMEPDGIGSLYLAYEQLKEKLEKEGLFAKEMKQVIPRYPRAIGVITSPTGAAIRDIITTLRRRHPAAHILIHPVSVQGTQAAPSIVNAIQVMNELRAVDVLIVGRGGGSLEELWAFNEESVARSIFASEIPIISAVGHETDVTIADFVADLRAATPTAAAELAVPHHEELKQQIDHMQQQLRQNVHRLIQLNRDRLERLRRHSYFVYPHKHFLASAERLDRLRDRMRFALRERVSRSKQKAVSLEHALLIQHPKEQMNMARSRIRSLDHQLKVSVQVRLKEKQQQLTSMIRHLDALSPLKVMQRGYSLVYKQGETKVVKSIQQVQPGDMLDVKLSDGRLGCQIWSMEGNEANGGE